MIDDMSRPRVASYIQCIRDQLSSRFLGVWSVIAAHSLGVCACNVYAAEYETTPQHYCLAGGCTACPKDLPEEKRAAIDPGLFMDDPITTLANARAVNGRRVRICRGEDDDLIPREATGLLANAWGTDDVLEIPNGGHLNGETFKDHPEAMDELARHFREFLQSLREQ